jgi:hypothetical protein
MCGNAYLLDYQPSKASYIEAFFSTSIGSQWRSGCGSASGVSGNRRDDRSASRARDDTINGHSPKGGIGGHMRTGTA